MASGLNLVGFDAWGVGPSASAAKAANVSFRTWYSSNDSSKDCPSAAALASFANEGVWNLVNYENNINDYTGGYNAGYNNFNHAVAEYTPYGMPKGASVILSVDESVSTGSFSSVLPYFQGAHAAAKGEYLVGCYGEQALIAYLKQQGVIQVGWRTMSTSFPGGSSTVDCDIIQTQGGTIGGASIDWNTNTSDLSLLGCWKPNQLYPSTGGSTTSNPTVPISAIPGEDIMIVYGPSGTVYLLSGGVLHAIDDPASLVQYQAASPSLPVVHVDATEEANLKTDYAPVSAALSALITELKTTVAASVNPLVGSLAVSGSLNVASTPPATGSVEL
jgi:hypothetical protein